MLEANDKSSSSSTTTRQKRRKQRGVCAFYLLKKIAKVVHDDLNAGGGSERLAIITIGLLNEMGFKVDVASFKKPDVEQIRKGFGDIALDIEINRFIPLDLFSILGISSYLAALPDPNFSSSDFGKYDNLEKEGARGGKRVAVDSDEVGGRYNDSRYDLIINTHGDLLPYLDAEAQMGGSNTITYCHFPLVPKLLEEKDSRYIQFLDRWLEEERANKKKNDNDNVMHVGTNDLLKQRVLQKVIEMYDLMMKKTIVVTNSHFSKKAIEERYGPAVKPIVVYPPVDVEKFRQGALNPSDTNRENTILVVSRFSPDKKLENAIEISKILAKKQAGGIQLVKTVFVGNIAPDDQPYLEKLSKAAQDCRLEDRISFEVGVSFDRLMDLMRKSKIYLHPLAGEPFGISIVEAMSAGLIPVVPDTGGYTEFVPEQYQFHTNEQAADIIAKILMSLSSSFSVDSNKNDVNDLLEKEMRISESVSRFSTESYKAGLKKVITESILDKTGSSLPSYSPSSSQAEA